MKTIGIIGAGTMGAGIAQLAASNGCNAFILENNPKARDKARVSLDGILTRLVQKGKLAEAEATAIAGRLHFVENMDELSPCNLVVEAIVEDLSVKKNLFSNLEVILDESAVLATNTSSLSVTAIAAACKHPGRVVGIHFFNPAPLMPLVEVIPALQTNADVVTQSRALIDSWGKTTVLAKDTPGFIVNRVARPFYGEAVRILEEGIADAASIDWAMKTLGGFRMGPFELMDFIGNDINYAVTASVFESFFYDPRYKPSFTQKRLVEAGWLGRKSGRGYYSYSEGAIQPEPDTNPELGRRIADRIVAMLINEAADALYLGIASREDLDLAMTKGVNYPKGLLQWADDIGVDVVLQRLEALQQAYGEDRYRPSLLLRQMVREGRNFYTTASNQNTSA